MKFHYQTSSKREGLYVAGIALLAFMALGAGPVAAHTAELDCPFPAADGRTVVNFDTSRTLVSTTGEYPETDAESVNLVAGTYAVSLYSYDAYPARVDASQPHEQWKVLFKNTGTVVAESSAIGDLEDNVATSTLSETVDEALVLGSSSDSVTAHHAFYPDDSTANSLTPVCAAFDLVSTPVDNTTNTPPTITLIGSGTVGLNLGDTFTDPGATATDTEDGDLTTHIVVSGEVSTSTVGVYTLTYSVTDSLGSGATTTRTVTVIDNDTSHGGSPTTGSITFCKMIVDVNGVTATSNANLPAGTFTIPLSYKATDNATTSVILSPITFTAASFVPNENIIASSTNDAVCVTRSGLDFGYYIYGEETIGESGWNTPKYNDQYDVMVESLSDFFAFSTTTNENSDGYIVLGDIRPDRTLVLLNNAATSTTSTSTDNGGTGGGSDGTGGGSGDNSDSSGSSSSSGGSSRRGGGGSSVALRISNEEVKEVVAGIAMVEWDTNRSATSQVVYGTHSIADADIDEDDEDTNFGYESTTNELVESLTHHGVAVGGLLANTTYYFRPVSRRGNEIEVGEEVVINPELAGGSCVYMYDYLKRGWDNNPIEVKKLQIFLHNLEGHTNLEITGIFDDATFAAVSAFQEKYKADILTPWGYEHATGFSYILTTKKINEIFCKKAFPVTPAQQQEIIEFRAFYESLKQQGIGTGTSIPPREGNPPPYEGNTTPGEGENDGVIIDEGEIGMGTSTGTSTPLERGVLRNLAAAVFSMPETAAETTRCIFNFIIILAIIYIITSILVSSEDSALAREKHRMRRLMFFIGGTIIALAFALFFVRLLLPNLSQH